MIEKSFIVFIDKNGTEEAKQMAITMAQELFLVNIEFEAFDDEVGVEHNLKQAQCVKINGLEDQQIQNALEYLNACFSPSTQCTEMVCKNLIDILQDGHAMWWQSLECEYKVRIRILNNVPNDPRTFMLNIQGNEEPVVFASSYLSQLNVNLMSQNLKIDNSIDEKKIRHDFDQALGQCSYLTKDLYEKYDAQVLQTLLRWFYFIRGITPPNGDYKFHNHSKNDDSVIVLSNDDTPSSSKVTKNVADRTESTSKKQRKSIDSIGDSFGTKITPMAKQPALSPDVELLTLDSSGSQEDDNNNHSDHEEYLRQLDEAIRLSVQEAESLQSTKENSLLEKTAELTDDKLQKVEQDGSRRSHENHRAERKRQHSHKKSKQDCDRSVKRKIDSPYIQDNLKRPKPKPDELDDFSYNFNFEKLRPVILDGFNLALEHGPSTSFSCRPILIACQYFLRRGHCVVIFIPDDRFLNSMNDKHLLTWLDEKGLIYKTELQYESDFIFDRSIENDHTFLLIQYALKVDGVIVSKSLYENVIDRCPELERSIYNRRLMFTWLGDEILIPKDPLGRRGPELKEFLRFGEKISKSSRHSKNLKVMNSEICRELVHGIEEQLSAPVLINVAIENEEPMELHRTNNWNRKSFGQNMDLNSQAGLEAFRRNYFAQENNGNSEKNADVFEKQPVENLQAPMISQLSRIFDRPSISRALKQYPDVTNAERMSELIIDMMT